jgi:hypothetical protein
MRITSPMKGVEIKLVGGQLNAGPAEKAEAVIFILLPKGMATGPKIQIPLELYSGKELIVETTTTFFSPGQ